MRCCAGDGGRPSGTALQGEVSNHRELVDGVRADMAELRFNTAIAKLIELTNRATAVFSDGTPREVAEPLVLMVAPVAPHLGEELWRRLGHAEGVTYADFPTADPAL